jgi:hypothetical protein
MSAGGAIAGLLGLDRPPVHAQGPTPINVGMSCRNLDAVAAWAYMRNPANEAGTEGAVAHYTRATSERAAVAYEAFFPVWADNVPRVDPWGVINALRFSASSQVRKMTPASMIDDSLLQELFRSGYIKSLYPE